MDKKKEAMCLKKIEESVIDEGNVVTYTSVSRTMGLDMNMAKELLKKFVTSGKFKVSATYHISGTNKKGTYCVSIVKESELDKVREKFVDIIAEDVYSVQKCKEMADYQMLYAANTFDMTSDWKANPISCSLCVAKDPSEQPTLKPPEKPKPIVKMPLKVANKLQEKQADVAVKEVPKKVEKVEKPAVGKKGSISSMFSAQQKKASEKKESEKLAKVDNKSAKEKAEVEEKKNDKNLAKKEVSKAKTRKTPSKRVIKEKQEETKKRKRIRVLSDSEESGNESDRDIFLDPEPEAVHLADEESGLKPSTSSLNTESHKRKKRKVVEKQELDEQGYLQTTKEVVFETDSEAEPEPEVPAPKPKETKKEVPTASKKPSPKKGKGRAQSDGRKQASLFAFFKKS